MVPDMKQGNGSLPPLSSSTCSFSSVLLNSLVPLCFFFFLLTNLPTFQALGLELEPSLSFFLLPRSRTNLPVMFFSFIGLVLASTVSAKVIDIQVGGDGGALVFSPEAIVGFFCHNLCFFRH